MAHLLDVNVMVALFDADHIHHGAAHAWFGSARESGWATCPLTENGLVRVLSNPAYPGRRTTVADAVERLRRFTLSGNHTRWPDDISILGPDYVVPDQLTGHREVTDTYLLALAVSHGGTLATFDQSVRTGAVVGAKERHLVLIPPGR
jgi:toxin-antitoxin system PIN domain toxin